MTAEAAVRTAADPAGETVFRSDMTVELVQATASDAAVVFAARVSTAGEQSLDALRRDPAESAGLINYLMRSRHGSPFEHNSFTFFVSAPIFVIREFMRHRVWSYNEESGRYRELKPVFYVPGPGRELQQVGKAGHYTFVPGTPEQRAVVDDATRGAYSAAYAAYQRMLGAGVAREVARTVLPVGIYSTMYATANARALMAFLSLRTKREDARFPSYPQREIELVAEQMEGHFARLMPITHAAFEAHGRVSP
jgi:thymidylate synthase (FAD)